MLVLTRSVGERLIINDGEIKISVLEVKGNQVRIGIDAPKSVVIHREEIYNRIKQETQAKNDNQTEASANKVEPQVAVKTKSPAKEAVEA